MKNEVNRFTVRFLSRSANEGFARSAAAAFIAQLDPTLDELEDVKTAVSEAVTNAVVHGYRDKIGDITMTVKLFEDDIIEIVVSDKGCGIEDVEAARAPLFTTGGAGRSGMGFTIMDSFMDELRVRSHPGKGTTVVMKKRLNARRYK